MGEFLTVPEVADRIPGRCGKRLNPSTIIRWILNGVPDRSGVRRKLPACRAGCRWLIRPGDLAEFFERLGAAPSAPQPPAPTRSATRREEAVQAACARLSAAGA